MSNKTDRTK